MKGSEVSEGRMMIIEADAGDLLPDALAAPLKDAGIESAIIRGSGVVSEAEIAVPESGGRSPGFGPPRKLTGMLQVVSLDVRVRGPSISARGVFARETDRGIETLAGDLVSARALVFEGIAWEIGKAGAVRRAPENRTSVFREPTTPPREAPPAWAEAVSASAEPPRERERPPAPAPPGMAAPIPHRPQKPVDLDQAFPEAGDVAEHFAFGRCEVLKSDGDRLHLRLAKDGRIKEIALEMLKVVPLGPTENGKKRFKLERKM